MHTYNTPKKVMTFIACLVFLTSKAQTDFDADMMAKDLFCSGFMYSSSAWDHYWEGTLKRKNENIGTVTTQMFAYMGAYGVSKKFNLLFGLPYVKTKASAGTLHGMKGVQDLSLFAKWMPYSQNIGKGKLSLIGVGGFSFPASNYTPDFLPMSIGLGSKTVTGRLIADYQIGNFFATASGTYFYRNNITIDRDAYYTTEMHLTNEVQMPNANSVSLRTGYRTKYLWAEAVFNKFTTLGGFDISRNNMPFPSNRMNATSAGFRVKYTPKSLDRLSLLANGDYVLSGRNVGQSTSIAGSIFYILSFRKNKRNTTK
ncbi:MAG TPA: hypothetical protein VEZ55_12350 [Chitinophagaceae bacterium]|jgi:hypothetical protein|nr:hypothetical protein [Chitinophagaceae bacterium]